LEILDREGDPIIDFGNGVSFGLGQKQKITKLHTNYFSWNATKLGARKYVDEQMRKQRRTRKTRQPAKCGNLSHEQCVAKINQRTLNRGISKAPKNWQNAQSLTTRAVSRKRTATFSYQRRRHAKIDPIRKMNEVLHGLIAGLSFPLKLFRRRLSSGPMRRTLSTQDGGDQCNKTKWFDWLVWENADDDKRRIVNWFPTKLYMDESKIDREYYAKSLKDCRSEENEEPVLDTDDEPLYKCAELGSPWAEFPSMTLHGTHYKHVSVRSAEDCIAACYSDDQPALVAWTEDGEGECRCSTQCHYGSCGTTKADGFMLQKENWMTFYRMPEPLIFLTTFSSKKLLETYDHEDLWTKPLSSFCDGGVDSVSCGDGVKATSCAHCPRIGEKQEKQCEDECHLSNDKCQKKPPIQRDI
jgi:hypothetical protein